PVAVRERPGPDRRRRRLARRPCADRSPARGRDHRAAADPLRVPRAARPGAADVVTVTERATRTDVLPQVDVVVPTRDRPELLRQTVDAILAQDYAGVVRVIVVFDQSEPDLTLVRADPLRPVLVVTNNRSP